MFTNFPLFPQQASAQAASVDGIYFFMLAVTAFFSLLIATLIVTFAIKFRRRHRDEVGVANQLEAVRPGIDELHSGNRPQLREQQINFLRRARDK